MKKASPPQPDPFRGVIIAAITPRREQETSIDLAATLELVDSLGRSGASAIALLGTTGEFVHFDLDDRRHMTDFAVKRSRVPLLVNVSHSTLDGALELAREAAASGVGGLLLMPPYYFRYSQEAIRTFYLEFAARFEQQLPVYLYNIPQFTNEIAVSTSLALLDTGLFAGIKDSGGSWEYFTRLREHCADRYSILIGNDCLYARARSAGAHGIVSGVACAVPELMVGIEAAIDAGDFELVQNLDARVAEFMQWMSKFPAPVAIKQALRQRRTTSGALAVALSEAEEQDMQHFLAWFRPWLDEVNAQLNTAAKTGRSGGR